MALIEVADAYKAYGSVAALDGVDLSVEAGACVALVGESGSGKTTLLRAVNGLTMLDRGTVRVRGQDVRSVPPVQLRRSLGYVQQDGGLIPHWTVLRNASLVPTLLEFADPTEPGQKALAAVGLDSSSFGSRFPKELSGGQRQRVAIARAVAAEPDILLMDEPFGALDSITRSEVQSTFAGLRRATGVTTIFVTHDLREAMELATSIAVMRNGQIVELGTPQALRATVHPYARELLGKAGIDLREGGTDPREGADP